MVVIGMLLIKNGVCYTYAFELVPPANRPFVNSAINLLDCSTLMWISLYVLFINKYYLYIMEVYVIFGIIAWIILVLFVPESPKWFFITGRHNDCVLALETIAKFNGSTKPINFLESVQANNTEALLLSACSTTSHISSGSDLSDFSSGAIEAIMAHKSIIPSISNQLDEKVE